MAWWDSSRRSLGASLRSKKQLPPVVQPQAPAPAPAPTGPPTGPPQKPRHIDTHSVPPHSTMELERALLSPITEEQPVVATLAEATNTGPLVVHVHIQFHDQDLHSVTHSQTYVSSPYFEPTGRICNGLLRRIEHCSEELITRTDPTALDILKAETNEHKPLRFELSYRVTRAGWMGEWAVRTYRSYQQRPLTAALAKEVIIASHKTIGMFFRRHDSDFRWLGGSVLDATTETAESSLESEVGQMSLGAVPSPRFIEESQTFETVPGYSIEIAFRHRNPRRLIPAFKRVVKVYSKQPTPLTAELGRDLLAHGAEAINRSLGLRKQKLEIHAQQCTSMTCQHRDSTALNIDMRISNQMGPSHNNLQRSIRSSLSLFHDSHGEDFVRDVEESLADVTQAVDTQINHTNDFEFTIVELKGVKWSVQEPATFTVGASASHGRKDIQAVLERIQTGIGDVLQGHNTALRVNARKRGHLVFQEVIQTHEIPGKSKEIFQSPDEERSVLTSRLRERIQKDIDMIFKDTCSIDDIALEEEERHHHHHHPTEVPLSPGLSVEWPERQNGASLEFPPLSAKTSTERVNDNPMSFVKRAFSLKRRSTSSLRQSLRSIASSRSSLNSQDDTYSVDIPHIPHIPARPVSPTPATSTKSSKKRFSLGKKISNIFKSKDSKSDAKSESKSDAKSESSSKRRFFRSSSSKSSSAASAAPAEPKLMRAHTTTEGSGGRTLHRPTRSMTSNPLGSYDATPAARSSVEHPRPFQAATPNLANRHGFASKTFETYPQPADPRWSVDRLERPVMDTPQQLYEDAKEFPHQLLTPGLTTRSTETPNSYHWLASPGADAYSTAPSTPALSLGGESSPRHSLLISPIHVRHPELKDNTSSDFEPESEPEEPEVENGVAVVVDTSVAGVTEVLEPPEDEVRSVVFAPQHYTTQPEEEADGADEDAVDPESQNVSATVISVEDAAAAPSNLHKPEPIISSETLASENREVGTEPEPLSNEAAFEESDFPKLDTLPPQPSHETVVSVDAPDTPSETESAPDYGTEVQNAPVVQNEDKTAPPETDYFKDFESLSESVPTADVIGSDVQATEANNEPVHLADHPSKDLNNVPAESEATLSGPEEDQSLQQDDQEVDTQVSDVVDVASSSEEVAHDVQQTESELPSGPEELTTEPDIQEADVITSETRDEPPLNDEVTEDRIDDSPEDENVRAPSTDETGLTVEPAAQETEQAPSNPDAEAADGEEDHIETPAENLKQNGTVDLPSDIPKPAVADHTIFEVLGGPVEVKEHTLPTDTSSEGSVSEHDKESSEPAEGDSISPAESETLVEDPEEEEMVNTLASLHISDVDKVTGASTKGHHVFFPWTTSAVGPASELLEPENQHLGGSPLVARAHIPHAELHEPSGLGSKNLESEILGPVSAPVRSKEDVHIDNDASEIPDGTPDEVEQTDSASQEKDQPRSQVDSTPLEPSGDLDSKSEANNASEVPEAAAEFKDIQENDYAHITAEATLPSEEIPDSQQEEKPEVSLSEVDRADEPVPVATVEQAPDADQDYELSFGTVETPADIIAPEAVHNVQQVEHVEDVGAALETPDLREDEEPAVSAPEPDMAVQNVRSSDEKEQPTVSSSDTVEFGHASEEVYDNSDVVEEKLDVNERDTECRYPTFPQFWPNSNTSSVFIPFAPHEALDNDSEHADSLSAPDVSVLGANNVEYRDPTLPQFRLNDVLRTAAHSYVIGEPAEEAFEAFEPIEPPVSGRVEEKADDRDPTMPQFRPHVLLRSKPIPLGSHDTATEDTPTSQEAADQGKDEAEYRDPTMPQFRPNFFGPIRSPSVSTVLTESEGYEEPPASLVDEASVDNLEPGEDSVDYRDPTMPQFRPNSFLESIPISSVSDESADKQGEGSDGPSEDDGREASSPVELSEEYRDPTMPQFKPNWDGSDAHHLSQAGTEQPTQENVELTNVGPHETEKSDDAATDVNVEETEPAQPEHVDTESLDTQQDEVPVARLVKVEPPKHVEPDVPLTTESAVDTSSASEGKEAEVEPTKPANMDSQPLPAPEQSQESQEEELPQDQYDTLFEPVDPRAVTESDEHETGAPGLSDNDSDSESEPASEPIPELYQDQYDAFFEPREEHDLQVATHEEALQIPEAPKIKQVDYRDPTLPQFRANVFLPYRDPTMPQFMPNAAMILSPISVPDTVPSPIKEHDADYIVERTMDILDEVESENTAALNEESLEQAISLAEEVLEQFGSEAERTENDLEKPEAEQSKGAKDPLEEVTSVRALEEAENILEQIEAEAEQTEGILEHADTERAERAKELLEEGTIEHVLEETEDAIEKIEAEAEQTNEILKELDADQAKRVCELVERVATEHALEQTDDAIEKIEAELGQAEELLEEIDVEQAERTLEIAEDLAIERALEENEKALEQLDKELERTGEHLEQADVEIRESETALEESEAKQDEPAEMLEQHESQEDVAPTAADQSTEEFAGAPKSGEGAGEVPESFLDAFPDDNEQIATPEVLPAEGILAEAVAKVPLLPNDSVSEPSPAAIGTQETSHQPTVTGDEEPTISEPTVTEDVRLEHPGIELANLEDEGLEDADVEPDVPAAELTSGPVIVNCDNWVEHTDLGDVVLETPVSAVRRVTEESSSHEPLPQKAHLEFPDIEHANLEDEGLEDGELQADATLPEPVAEPVVVNCDTWVEHADAEDNKDANVQAQQPAIVSAGEETITESIETPAHPTHEEEPAEKVVTLAEPTPMAECVARPGLELLAAIESQSEQETGINVSKIESDINEEETLAGQVSHVQDAGLFEEQHPLSEVVDRSLGITSGAEDTDDSTGDVDTHHTDGSLRVESLEHLVRYADEEEMKLRELPEVEPIAGDVENTQGEEVPPALEPMEEPLAPTLEAISEEVRGFDKTPVAIPTIKPKDKIAEEQMLQSLPAAALPDLCLLEQIAPHEPISSPAIGLVTKEPSEHPGQQPSDIPSPAQAFGVSPRGSVDTIRGSDVDEEEAPELYAPPPTAGFFGFHHYHENKWAKVGLFEVWINSTSRRFSLPLQSLLQRKYKSEARQQQ
ncbi:hypothetical protein B0T20DRAFT_479672 [Sordaria brevicollis]|uniref:Pt repeat family protein n=1 Tax=Sordaria brevicollis TaxID=83679 RepID=A0AAE0PDD7_SORBR|nr:hypothetical protein B0T20DRAFT_479672 [Sordaria brevicollis]